MNNETNNNQSQESPATENPATDTETVEAEPQKQVTRKANPVIIGLGALCAILAIALIAVSAGLNGKLSKTNTEIATLQSEAKKSDKQIKDYKGQNNDLTAQVSDLNSQVNDLTDQVSTLQKTNDSLSSENDELKNGAQAQLVEIKNAHEAGDWQGTIDKYNKLHQQYNGSAEDQEAKALADDAQAQLDAAAQAQAAEEAKGYETGITYDQLARTPDDYMGKKVKFSGKVVQVIEGDGDTQLRVAVNNNYDTILFAEYSSDIVTSRVLEDDQITLYGTSVGTISYQSTMGGTITIPAVLVAKIDQ